ncbi:MAG: hypothetical protein FWH22_03640 [Fibromonadales bacterium]|nr:hypothetical protein [Fibromonadales bacterium]
MKKQIFMLIFTSISQICAQNFGYGNYVCYGDIPSLALAEEALNELNNGCRYIGGKPEDTCFCLRKIRNRLNNPPFIAVNSLLVPYFA